MTYSLKSLLYFNFLLFFSNINCQVLRVVDHDTGLSIPSALFYNEDRSISKLTDFEGKISTDVFNKTDSITVSHISYNDSIFTYEELKNLNILTTKNEIKPINDPNLNG